MSTGKSVLVNERWHARGFMVSQADGKRSIDRVVITGGARVFPGTVMGRQTTAPNAVASALFGNSGNGIFSTLTLVTIPTQIGNYSVTLTSATTFDVTWPSTATASGTVGTPFSALGIGFTITAGATAFVAGDAFTIVGADAVGKPTLVATANAGNTGNGTMTAPAATGYAPSPGTYIVNFDDPTHFVLSSPSGIEVGHGAVAQAFSAGGLNFTVTAGSAPFAPGDAFTIVVGNGPGKWVPCTATAADGSQNAAGICFGLYDATINDVYGAMVMRDCEINTTELFWDASMDADSQTKALKRLDSAGIIAR